MNCIVPPPSCENDADALETCEGQLEIARRATSRQIRLREECEAKLDEANATIAQLKEQGTRNIPGGTTVVYKTDSALSDAVEFAHKHAAKRYPGGEVMIRYIDDLTRQHLAGTPTKKG